MRVAFLGLGIMGRPMAANLVKAGHEVAVGTERRAKTLKGRVPHLRRPKLPTARKWSGCASPTPKP